MLYRSAQTTVTSPRDVTIFIPYGARDSYDTTFERGCFTQSLSAKLPPVLWSHRPDEVVGKVTDFRERADGLELDIRLADPDRVPSAAKVSALLSEDMVPGISFGFREGLSKPHPFLRGVQQFVRAVMDEVSFVAKPSIPGTRVLSLRHARTAGGNLDLEIAVALARRKLDRMRRR